MGIIMIPAHLDIATVIVVTVIVAYAIAMVTIKDVQVNVIAIHQMDA